MITTNSMTMQNKSKVNLMHKIWNLLVFYVAGHQAEKTEYLQSFLSIQANLPATFFAPGSDEFFVGRAGYLSACAMLNRRFQRSVIPNEITLQLCNLTIESGRQYSKKFNHPSPLMYSYYNTEYLGLHAEYLSYQLPTPSPVLWNLGLTILNHKH